MKTNTPRTDIYVLNPQPEVVAADFARELEIELYRAKSALSQIFAWFDANDGHLITNFPDTVTPKMNEFRDLCQ